MNTTYERLGELIKSHRKEKQYSTSTLSEKLGVSVGLINNLENGRNDVFKLELFENLVKELGIPLEELFDIHSIDIDNIIENYSINDNEELSTSISKNLKLIIKTYLDTITQYNYDVESIEYISSNIVGTLETIQHLKAKSSL